MALPAAARKQLEEAEQLHKDMYAPDEAEKDEDSEKEHVKAIPQEVVQEAPQPVEAQEPTPEPTAPVDGEYEQKYKTLQGMYNAEVPRMQGQIRQMEDLIATLQTPQPVTQEVAEPTQQSLLNKEEIEDYGPEMIDVVKRAAQEALMPQINKLMQENAQLKQQVGGVSKTIQTDAHQTMLDTLDGQVATWRSINTSEGFLQWLQELDAYSGVRRHDLLKNAWEKNDAARVMAFFKVFDTETEVVAPSAEQPQQRKPQVDMNSLVAPGKPVSGESPSSGGAEKRRWTQDQIATFYTKCSQGKFKGKQKERESVERDIFAAMSEGRIVG
jgi:hypothetical protein